MTRRPPRSPLFPNTTLSRSTDWNRERIEPPPPIDRPAKGRRYLHEDRGVAKAVRGRAQDNLEAPWRPPAVGKRDEGADGALRHSIRHRGAGSVASLRQARRTGERGGERRH